MAYNPDELEIARFNARRITDRKVTELVTLGKGMLADGVLLPSEVEYLVRWIGNNLQIAKNPVIAHLLDRMVVFLKDGLIDDDETRELAHILGQLSGDEDGDGGGPQLSATLPLDAPPPMVAFRERSFCLTGQFAHGTRKHVEWLTEQAGGRCVGDVTMRLDYLVVGQYATQAWIHSTFGRKIEKAVAYRDKGKGVRIIHEPHWLAELQRAGVDAMQDIPADA